MRRPLRPRADGRRLLAADQGASTVEFAITFPLFLLLLLGILEFARAIFAANTLQWGVAQAARYVTVHNPPTYSLCCPDGCSPSWDFSRISSFLGISGMSMTATAGAASCAASQPSIQITVTGTYHFDFFLSSTTAGSVGLDSGIAMSQRAIVSIPLN